MSARSVVVGMMFLAMGGCTGDRIPFDPYSADCLRPAVDTTGWQRVTESRECGLFCSMRISYLVPPSFERVGPFAWERNATRTEWFGADVLALPDPFPEMEQTGSCRAQISDHRAFIDYGSLGGDIMPDHIVLAYWRSTQMVGTRGDILFSARMRDAADRAVIESMIWSVQIARGGPGG